MFGWPSVCLDALHMFGCPTVCLDAAKCMVASKGMRVLQTYGGCPNIQGHPIIWGHPNVWGAYAHLSLTKHAFCLLYMYSRHPNIFQTYMEASKHRGAQSYRGYPKIFGAPRHTGGYPNILGHPNIQGVHPNICGCPNIWGHPNRECSTYREAFKQRGGVQTWGHQNIQEGVQTYGGVQTWGHPNIQGAIQTYGASKQTVGASKYMGGVHAYRGCPNIWGHPNIHGSIETYGGIPRSGFCHWYTLNIRFRHTCNYITASS